MKKALINDKEYQYEVLVKTESDDKDATHIVQPSHNSIALTSISVECIKKYTEDYVLWIVDNFSDERTMDFLAKLDSVNIIFNHTKIGTFLRPWYRMPYGGSLANAVALELAAKVIDCKYMFVMHNDCVPVKKGWLLYLKSKLNDEVKIAGVSQDISRIHAVHQSGFLFDFELGRRLNLSFMPSMPEYDVGDGITKGLLENGYKYFVCKNTFNNKEAIELLNHSSYPEFLRAYPFDKSFNDNGELIYVHLGRGSKKFRDLFSRKKRLSKKDWIRNARKYFLSGYTNNIFI